MTSAVSPDGLAQYSILCRPTAGTVDDIFVYRLPDRLFICLNASNTDKDVDWLQAQCAASGMDCTVENLSDTVGMIAVQGPRALGIVQQLTEVDLAALPRFGVIEAMLNGVPTIVGRTGYTGEDGVELYPPISAVVDLWRTLLDIRRMPMG